MGKRHTIACGGALLVALGAASTAYLLGWWMPNFPNLADYPVRGIDISHHQGKINWKIVSANGIKFAYIKASEGGDFQDDHFRENMAGATQAGLPCGAYHFFTLTASGLAQAQNFIHTVPPGGMQLPPVVDLETWPERSRPFDLKLELDRFMKRVSDAYGARPFIYTSSSYIHACLTDYPIHGLWLRAVVFTPAFLDRPDWCFWQFTEKARVNGVDGFVDMDVFNGSREQFKSLLARQDTAGAENAR